MASLFEEMGSTYIFRVVVMYCPGLQLLKEKMPCCGKYGSMRHTYLQEEMEPFYATLLFDGKLVAHLNENNDAAISRIAPILKKMCSDQTVKAP